MIKLTIIGGGSYAWTHTLVADLCLCSHLSGKLELMLYDINAENLKDVKVVADLINRELGNKLVIKSTVDREDALNGADFVAVTISTGGLEAMKADLEIPARYGIAQSVGDTTGPGGLSRAWRNVPVFIDIARAMEKYCPDAWMLNLTNPLTVLTQAVIKSSSIKTVGLCHEIYHVQQRMGRLLGVDNWREQIRLRCIGINHFTWITEMSVGKRDALVELRTLIDDEERLKELDNFGNAIAATDIGTKTSLGDGNRLKFELFRRYGALPGCGDRHIAEFLPWTLKENPLWKVNRTPIENRLRMLEDVKRDNRDMRSGEMDIPRQASIESFAYIVAALAGLSPPWLDVLNRPNSGQVPDLPYGALLEGQVVVSKDCIEPLAYGKLPDWLKLLLEPIAIRQEMIVKASMERDENLALQALLSDPLIDDYNNAVSMWDELLAANRRFIQSCTGDFYPEILRVAAG